MSFNIRREDQPGATLQVPLPEQAVDGRPVVHCEACHWTAWGRTVFHLPTGEERARAGLQELVTVTERGLLHAKAGLHS